MTWIASDKDTWVSDYGKILKSGHNEYYASLLKSFRDKNNLKLVNYGPFYSLSEAKQEISKLAAKYTEKKGNKTFA